MGRRHIFLFLCVVFIVVTGIIASIKNNIEHFENNVIIVDNIDTNTSTKETSKLGSGDTIFTKTNASMTFASKSLTSSPTPQPKPPQEKSQPECPKCEVCPPPIDNSQLQDLCVYSNEDLENAQTKLDEITGEIEQKKIELDELQKDFENKVKERNDTLQRLQNAINDMKQSQSETQTTDTAKTAIDMMVRPWEKKIDAVSDTTKELKSKLDSINDINKRIDDIKGKFGTIDTIVKEVRYIKERLP